MCQSRGNAKNIKYAGLKIPLNQKMTYMSISKKKKKGLDGAGGRNLYSAQLGYVDVVLLLCAILSCYFDVYWI